MFKKTKLAAVSAAILGAAAMQSASAVSFDHAGQHGQVLIFPYYNVNNGFQTSFSIRNTKDEYKVLKIRFRDSDQSNDTLDFNIYLSPYDMYTLTLSRDGDDVLLQTDDTSCTFPAIPADGVHFIHGIYEDTDAADTREGYVEVTEMGVIKNITDATMWPQGYSQEDSIELQLGIKHVLKTDEDGNTFSEPLDCSVVGQAWLSGTFTQGGSEADAVRAATNSIPVAGVAGATTYYSNEEGTEVAAGVSTALVPVDGLPNNLLYPTGGIEGYSVLLGITDGAAFVSESESIANYSMTPQHYLSDDIHFYQLPSLASGDNPQADVVSADGTAIISNVWTSAGDWGLRTSSDRVDNVKVPVGINPMPIANVLAATEVNNDYIIQEVFNTATDWVITFPMKKYGVFVDDQDILVSTRFWDREEQETTPADPGFSPPPIGITRVLEREANIVTFSTESYEPKDVLGSAHEHGFQLDDGFEAGWASFAFPNYDLVNSRSGAASAGTVTNTLGVPTLGFAAVRGNVTAGSSTNVGETFDHAYSRDRDFVPVVPTP